MSGDEGRPESEETKDAGETLPQREVRLLRIAAHDLRAPLANVRSYADLALSSKSPLEPRVHRALTVIRRNADRALGMVEDAIESLRMDRGGLPVEPTATPVQPALDKALARSRDRAEPSHADLRLELPPELPDVLAESERLARVLHAPLEHLLSRAQEGTVLMSAAVVRGQLEFVWLATPGETLAPAPFGREHRILDEGHLEDPMRLDVARRLAEAWGGELSTWSAESGDARGFRLQLMLARRDDLPLIAEGQKTRSLKH